MRLSIRLGLASLFLSSVFLAALSVAVSGARSILSDAFLMLAIASVVALGLFQRFRPPPSVPVTAGDGDRAVAFNGWAASLLGGVALLLIYRGSFEEHRQLVAVGSCVMTGLGAAILILGWSRE